MASSSFIPRKDRVVALGQRVYRRAHAGGISAIQAGVLAIEASCGAILKFNDDKLVVERAMRAGVGAVRTRCDWGKVALLCPKDVDGALREVNRNYLATIRDRQMRERSGFPLRHPGDERHFKRALIFLRWYRRFGDRERFPTLLDALTTSPHFAVELQAAE